MEASQDKTCKIIRSILLASKGGSTAEKLYNDYRETVGEGIPYRKLGYDNLHSFLKSIPDYCRISRSMKGELVVHGVADENTRHMQDLVNRSKGRPRTNRMPPVKGPTRRPMQHSAQWKPPQHHQHYRGGGGGDGARYPPVPRPFGRGGGVPRAGMGRGVMRVSGGGGGGGQMYGHGIGIGRGRGGANKFNNGAPQRSPLRKPRENFRGPGSRQDRGPPHSRNYQNNKSNKNTPPKGQQKKSQTNFRRDLDKYYVEKNLGEVQYKVAAVGKGKDKYMATVTVEATQFKTYPDTYNSKEEAEEAVAAKVVEKLGILSSYESESGSQETSDPAVYSARVSDILGARHNGVWSSQVEKDYLEMFGERLPSLWFQEADTNKIRVECPVIGSSRYIVFPVVKQMVSPVPTPQQHSASQPRKSVNVNSSKSEKADVGMLRKCEDVMQAQPPPLVFPTEEMWDIYVSYLRSAVEVSVRLIGPEYSEKLDELSGNMDMHYFDKSKIPVVKDPEIGKLYAAHVSSDWHRVKVVEIRGILCTCTFLDHGDHDTIPIEDLREIEPKFLELPAQAFPIALSGLEDYVYNENVITRLNELLLGKALVAKIDNKFELSQCYNNEVIPHMILFDTSSEVDVNINQKLIEVLVSEDFQNRLPQPGGEEIEVVILTILNTGEIYCRKEGNTFQSIQKQIFENTEKVLANGPSGLIGKNQIYLAEQGGVVYRAEVLSSDKCMDGRYSGFFVDTGVFAQLEASQIYDIPSCCDLCLDMPRLALKCTLEAVPPDGHTWSPEATVALREQAPENTPVRLKVVGGSVECPSVEIHQLNSNQGSINFDLSTEFDIFPALPTGLSSPDTSLQSSPAKSRNGDSNESDASVAQQTISRPLLPSDGEQFDVKVTCAVSPSNFIVQPYNESDKLAQLMEEMDNFYNKDNNMQEMTPDCMQEGAFLAGRHSDNYWYRIRITKVIDHASAAVRLVDYGDLSMLNLCDMQPLWAHFRNLPLQAINAKLANIQPANGDWRPEDTVWFSNRVADQEFVSVIRKRSPALGDDFEEIVELTLIDTTHPTVDKFVDQELIEEKRAVSQFNSDKASS